MIENTPNYEPKTVEKFVKSGGKIYRVTVTEAIEDVFTVADLRKQIKDIENVIGSESGRVKILKQLLDSNNG